ncbi:MAG TPA: FliI/YscN family ATPase [Gammaproteobacteria bacterium]|nr:FliI/YscN family ATPase [Gammaproteobacteria bacterium]
MRQFLEAVRACEPVVRIGQVNQISGLVVESNGPDVFLGELCQIRPSGAANGTVLAEVVALKAGRVLLMPYGDLRGISLGSEIIATGRPVDVPVGEALLGRVVDAFGQPLDDGPPIQSTVSYPLYAEPINPLARSRIKQRLETGVRAVDALLTVGKGQRMGIFAGSGVGKSTLLGMIARNMQADVNVIALIGERGREVLDFIEDCLGREGLARSVVVVATSDQPALVRSHAALAATAIAEFFRNSGRDVVLTMDSVTRFAMAQREIGLAIGEPPTARGYTPTVFTVLPKLLERSGTSAEAGSITAFYTVLVEGDDLNDPIADSVRSIIDGHIVLSRDLANAGHFPAIDVLRSVSRLMRDLQDEQGEQLAKEVVDLLSIYERSKDLVEVGAYRAGSNPKLDRALKLMPEIDRFLQQSLDEKTSGSESTRRLSGIFG